MAAESGRLLHELLLWSGQWQVLAMLAMILCCLVSALAVVAATHHHRQLFIQVRALEEREAHLNSEFGKLLLEKGAWSDYARIQLLAEQELGLHEPEVEELMIIRRGDLS